jgi:hypothetical protein
VGSIVTSKENIVATSIQVVFDCEDPGRLAEFWATALGYVVQGPPEGFDSWPTFLTTIGIPEERWNDRSAVVDPDDVGPRALFQKVPEPKTVKNRVHLDVNADGPHGTPDDERRAKVAAKVEDLVAAGASVLRDTEENSDH